MLQSIRNRAQGWIAWVIVILISIPFALWGVHEYTGGGAEQPVAEVAGHEIHRQEFQRAYNEQRMRLREFLGDEYDSAVDEQTLRSEVLEDLINERVLHRAALDAKMRLGDRELAERIRSFGAFRSGDDFDQASYRRALQAQGLQPGQFEDMLRRDLLIQQLEMAVMGTEFATTSEIDRHIALAEQRREVGFGRVAAADFMDRDAVTDEAITSHYEANRERYRDPERVALEYVILSLDDIAARVEVTEEELRAEFERNRAAYGASHSERRASHILILPDEEGEAGWSAALEQAEALHEELEAGADFAALAAEHSDDAASAGEGGDLGWFGRDEMDESVAEAAFAMNRPGQLSGPVRSDFGYHLIRLEAIEEDAEAPGFEEVRDEVRREFQRARAEALFFEESERLANQAYEHPDTLELAADAVGLAIRTTEPFTRDGLSDGIASHAEVLEVAFSADLLEDHFNSPMLELGDNTVAIVRMAEHFPAERLELAEVSERIRDELARERAVELARERAQELAGELSAGAEPQARLGDWQSPRTIGRQSREVAPAISAAAFRMPSPEAGQPRFRAVALEGGDQAVVGLYGVHSADPSEVPRQEREQLRRQMAMSLGRGANEQFVRALRDATDVSVRLREE